MLLSASSGDEALALPFFLGIGSILLYVFGFIAGLAGFKDDGELSPLGTFGMIITQLSVPVFVISGWLYWGNSPAGAVAFNLLWWLAAWTTAGAVILLIRSMFGNDSEVGMTMLGTGVMAWALVWFTGIS